MQTWETRDGNGDDNEQSMTTATAPLTTAGVNGVGVNVDGARGMGVRCANVG